MKRQHTVLTIVFILLVLLATVLACNTSNMRAKDMPIWACPTDVIPPTHTMEPGWMSRTPPPPTYTPWPTQTPYTLMSDFPLGKHVKIGGVGGIGIGIWVWLDDVMVSGHYQHENLETGETGLRWVTRWDVTVENASFTTPYEVYPFAQFYVFEVIEPNGYTATTGAWGISAEAHDEIGIPRLDVSNESNVLMPRTIRSYTVAAYIPTDQVSRIGYVLDPMDTENVEEMLERNTIGSNVGIWIPEYDDTCQNGEITPGFEGTGTPPGTGEHLLLGPPVSGGYIMRGYGCSDQYTGETDDALCPDPDYPWYHNGIDYVLPAGSPAFNVIDADQATVVHAGDDPDGPDCSHFEGSRPPHNGYGNYVRATATVNGHTLRVWWAHLSGFSVDAGDTMARNDVVGSIGSTGCSTGSHLHFTVEVDGVKVDPLTVMP